MASAAVPLPSNSDEFRRVEYLLRLSVGNRSISDVCIWHFSNPQQAIRFEKRTRGMSTVPSWINAKSLGDVNSLENLHTRGFSFPASGEGMVFSTGSLDLDNERDETSAHRFVLCQLGIGRAFVVDDPSEQHSLPDGYDSLYLALSQDGAAGSSGEYRHDFAVLDPAQVLPMYLVQFIVDPFGDSGNSAGQHRFAQNTHDLHAFELGNEQLDGPMTPSIQKLYDRYDFFDPVWYTPVSVRDKMVGSHSTGEAAQHKLIGIDDAYEAAVSESMKADALLNARQADIRAQLRAVDSKLRQVNENSAKVEEMIYQVLQEALFRLQDATQNKMSALLAEEVELRRQLQYIEWMESFLEHQREMASKVDFLIGWKCHVQLRGDVARLPLRTPHVLNGIHADMELVGNIQVRSRSEREKYEDPVPGGHEGLPPRQQQQPGSTATPQYTNQAPFISRLPQPQQQQQQNASPFSVPTPTLTPQPLASAQSDSSVTSSPRIPFIDKQQPSKLGLNMLQQQQQTQHGGSSRKPASPPGPPPEIFAKSLVLEETPNRFAQYSLNAEATRRMRQMKLDGKEAFELAMKAFVESKLLTHASESDFKEFEKEAGNDLDENEEGADEEEEAKGPRQQQRREKTKKSRLPIKVFSQAHRLYMCLPFISNSDLPVTRLLYATWKPNTERSVSAILACMPQEETEVEDKKTKGVRNVKVLEDCATLIIIRANGKVFGGYADEPWRTDGLTFGTARCFLFSMAFDIKIPFHGRETLEAPPRDSTSDSRKKGKRKDDKKKQPPKKQRSGDEKASTDANTGEEEEGEDDEADDGSEASDNDSYFQSFGALKSDENSMQFGVKDLVIRGSLASCSSELEFSFGVGLSRGSEDARTILAGSPEFSIDELELWEVRPESES